MIIILFRSGITQFLRLRMSIIKFGPVASQEEILVIIGKYIIKNLVKNTMKYFIVSLFSFISLNAFTQFTGLNKKEIATLRNLVRSDSNANKLYTTIRNTADKALTQNPDPIDTVVSEGRLATDPKKIRTIQSLDDIPKTYSLAIAYAIERNKNYLQKADKYLKSWALVNKPQGNPINDTKFEDLFFAYDLIKNNLSSDDQKTINGWLNQMAGAEIKTALPKTKKTSFNNWNSHRLKVIGLIAYLLNKDEYKTYIAEELPVQIEKNLLPDGSGIDFQERDALHYHIYTLEPLISLAIVLQRATGKDYYHYTTPSGSSIEKSINFLVPFVSGEKLHPEFINSSVAFDKKRADNKEAGYQIGAPFKQTSGVNVLIQASYFDPSCMNIVKKVLNVSTNYPGWQAVINAARK